MINIMENRRKILNSKLKDYKLSYNSICDQYIKFGIPDIDSTVKLLYEKQNEHNNRLYKLLNELKQCNLEYDNRIPSFTKYIKYGGNIKEVIQKSQLERVLINETNYIDLLKGSDSDTAKEISSIKYIKSGKKNKEISEYIGNKNTIKFE